MSNEFSEPKTSLQDKIILLCLSISLFGHVHYYFYPFTESGLSLAPKALDYILKSLTIVPLFLISLFNSIKNFNFTRNCALLYIGCVSIILTPILNLHDKESLKIFLFLALILSGHFIRRSTFHIFTSNVLPWIILLQSTLSIILWTQDISFWSHRQVGFLGNPSIMGILIVFSLSILSLGNLNRKNISISTLCALLILILALFLTGAKFCVMLYPAILVGTLACLKKRFLKRFTTCCISFSVMLGIYLVFRNASPPVVLSSDSLSYTVRLQQISKGLSSFNLIGNENTTGFGEATFGNIDNQVLDLYSTLGFIPSIIILLPMLYIFILALKTCINRRTAEANPTKVLAVILFLSFLVYRPIFYFPLSLFLAFSISSVWKEREEKQTALSES